MTFVGGYLFVGFCFFFLPSFFSCCWWKTLFIAHLGYLHSLSTFSRCYNSFLSNSGVEQMVCALCERMLITLYLADRL